MIQDQDVRQDQGGSLDRGIVTGLRTELRLGCEPGLGVRSGQSV